VDEFITVMTTPDGRVDGYTQNFPNGTPLATAKRAVLALMPSDTQTVAYFIGKGTSGQCGLWNLRSKMLGGWLSSPKVGDSQGDIGVSLNTVKADGSSTYDPSNINEAIVDIVPSNRSTPC
jgi:hypothetical protein